MLAEYTQLKNERRPVVYGYKIGIQDYELHTRNIKSVLCNSYKLQDVKPALIIAWWERVGGIYPAYCK